MDTSDIELAKLHFTIFDSLGGHTLSTAEQIDRRLLFGRFLQEPVCQVKARNPFLELLALLFCSPQHAGTVWYDHVGLL